MTYKKIITMTGWRRPEYTKQVIDNLKKCIGFEEYTILPTIEPGHPEVLNIFNSLPNCNMVVNDTRLGCDANTLKALQRGFEISDFVIHLEDDTVPGIDALKYFEWVYNKYKYDKEVFTVTAYNRIHQIDYDNYFTTYKRKWFTGWLWGTWIDRFEEMSKNWNFQSWDKNINKRIRGNRYEICPSLPRSQNIGQHLSANVRPDYWKKYHYNPIWVNNILDPYYTYSFSDIITNSSNLIYKDIGKLKDSFLSEEYQLETQKLMLIGILIGSTYLVFG